MQLQSLSRAWSGWVWPGRGLGKRKPCAKLQSRREREMFTTLGRHINLRMKSCAFLHSLSPLRLHARDGLSEITACLVVTVIYSAHTVICAREHKSHYWKMFELILRNYSTSAILQYFHLPFLPFLQLLLPVFTALLFSTLHFTFHFTKSPRKKCKIIEISIKANCASLTRSHPH